MFYIYNLTHYREFIKKELEYDEIIHRKDNNEINYNDIQICNLTIFDNIKRPNYFLNACNTLFY